jgi:hypothetical protein
MSISAGLVTLLILAVILRQRGVVNKPRVRRGTFKTSSRAAELLLGSQSA